MAEHTPGPWEATDRPGQGWQICARVPHLDQAVAIQEVPITPRVQIGDDGKVYVVLSYETFNQFPSDNWLEMQAANARLFAAAPDLLKALRHLLTNPNGDLWRREARAAIKKAEEESNG